VLIIPSLGVPNWSVIYINTAPQSVDFVIFDPLILTLQPTARCLTVYCNLTKWKIPHNIIALSHPRQVEPFAGRRRGRWRAPGGAAPTAAIPGSAGGVEFKEDAKPVLCTAFPRVIHLLGVLPDHDGRVGVEFADDVMQGRSCQADSMQALPCNGPAWRRHPLRLAPSATQRLVHPPTSRGPMGPAPARASLEEPD
jgi:hypothetical protein